MDLQRRLDKEIDIILNDDSLSEDEKNNQIVELEKEARELSRDDYFEKLERGEL